MSWVKAATALHDSSSAMEDVLKQLILSNHAQQQALAQQQKFQAETVHTQQQANHAQQQALAQQQKFQAESVQAQQETNRLFMEQIAALRETMAAQPSQGVISPAESTNVRKVVQRALQKMTPNDDVEAYLSVFERVAERERLPVAEWADVMAPYLTGEPQKAYYDLGEQDVRDYAKLKVEILARLGVTPAVRARRFHRWSYTADTPARSQMYDLVHLAQKWLEPETSTTAQMVEKVVVDRYFRSLPAELQRWVGHGDPKTADQLVNMVERFVATEDYLRVVPAAPPPARTDRLRPSAEKKVPAGGVWQGVRGNRATDVGRGLKTDQELQRPLSPRNDFPLKRPRNLQCWRCQEWGHIAAYCPLTSEPMECDASRRQSLFAVPAYIAAPGSETEPHMCRVQINDCSVKALLDSGSLVTLVRANLVSRDFVPKKQVKVLCIHGDMVAYPVAPVEFMTPLGTVSYEVGVVKRLMYDVILGRDFPLFWGLWNRGDSLVSGETSPTESPSLPVPDKGTCEGLYENVTAPEMCEDEFFPLQVLAGEEEEVALPSQQVLDLEVSRGNFGTEQLRDPTLRTARANVTVLNGVPQEPEADQKFPHFSINGDLVYRVTKINKEIVEQLLVPKPYRKMVLDIAHNHVLGGHLGTNKTQERVLQRFFWPGVYEEVKRYCESCPTCQVHTPTPHFRSPLVPLPIIEVPFERIAMDLVGPIVKSARGHQYILVVLDYATRYPEAVPLRNMASKNIARELFYMFSRTGIPKEILTDQGTPFMSKVMKELCKLFKISHIRTSVYHPQTDGLVERFNKTLKHMLKKVVERDGRDWDCLLPHLMFSIREVPQASTGFSPFELVYGRHPRGLLDVAKETWETEATPYKSVVEHVAQMQERIATVMPIVREHLQRAQEAQSKIYNRTASVRNFNPGDRVLILVPTVESKFLAKWQGPYEIVEKLSEVNYKVHQPDKRKPFQVYHVNLIKPWKDRESLVATHAVVKDGVPPIPPVTISEALSGHQKQEVREFLQENRHKFSNLPGRTHLIRHHIKTEPHSKVYMKPYRIPEARREAVSSEVKHMLELGVIEESSSEWSSPIVLIPKPNGTWRFCNDFRKLNEVSKFDAYPMPRVDELIERLGKARYITTLDLTKGYWQIPLSQEAKEKTAFATPEGLFQYNVMPFGLHGAPATFQRLMDLILRPHRDFAAAYLDDVVIFSSDWKSHLCKVQAVLDSISEAGLTINPEKCAVGLEEAKYLGYIIGRGMVKPQVNKIEAIQNWPRPLTKKQVRAFLGIAGYYRRFVPNFASVAAPLSDLTKGSKSAMIEWNPEAETAFQNLKSALSKQPVLVSPDFRKQFLVQTDASDTGLGAVLSQVVNGEEHPVMYLSRKLTPAEKNYAIVERECLAIKWAVESLKYYLLGREFVLITDHAPLTWMKQSKERNARVTRWFLSLQNFCFRVEHRSGKLQGNADALSRVYCMFMVNAQTGGLKKRGGICGKVLGRVVEGVYISPGFLNQMI